MKTIIRFLLLVGLVGVPSALGTTPETMLNSRHVAYAAPSQQTGITQVSSVFSSGTVGVGTTSSTATSANYQMQVAIGQPGLPNNATTLSSGNYQHQPGFLAMFLPKQEATGDINADGSVNIFDLQILIQMIISGRPEDPTLYPIEYWQRAELNGDGGWTIFDLQKLINLITS
ncbi:MAG: dockerin type I repeat-containing protein [Chloroflexota bacterium]